MSEPTTPAAPPVPAVDHPEVAEALRLVADLDDQPLEHHQERLSRVHEVLHGVLHPGTPAR
ncbi:hypothetical protein GCM10009616_10370 [Microlunatus lacustris]